MGKAAWKHTSQLSLVAAKGTWQTDDELLESDFDIFHVEPPVDTKKAFDALDAAFPNMETGTVRASDMKVVKG